MCYIILLSTGHKCHLLVLYLQSPWPLLLQTGSCLLGRQRTSWTRPWLLWLSLRRSHIRLNRQQRELLFNTLCLSQTPVSLHVPAGLTQTKPAQRDSIRLASQIWVVPRAIAHSADSTHPVIKPPRQQQAKREPCEDDAKKILNHTNRQTKWIGR